MKLNIQMFAEGTQIYTGSFNGSSASYAQLYAIRTYTQDDTVFPAKTNETITLYIKKLSSIIYSNNVAAPYSIKDGNTLLKSGTCSFNLGNIGVGSSQKIAEYSRPLTHKEDGTLDNYTLNVTLNTQVSLGTGTISKTVTTPTVSAGYSVSGENYNLAIRYFDVPLTIKVGVRENTGYKYDLSYEFTNKDGVVTTGDIDSNLTTPTYDWFVTNDQINSFLTAMPTKNEMPLTLKLVCTTYKDGNIIGVPTTSTVEITTSIGPTINPIQPIETVDKIKALTNSEYVVKDLSKLQFSISALPNIGSTIESYELQVEDRVITSDSKDILVENIVENKDGKTTFSYKTIDSRGNTGDVYTTSLNYIDYIKCEYKNTDCEIKRTEGDMDKVVVTLLANYFNGKIGTTTNSLTLSYKYREKGTTNYTTGTTTLVLNSDIVLNETFDHTKNYEFIFTINDLIYTGSEMSKIVPSSQYVMFEHETGVDFLNATIMGEQVIHSGDLSLVSGRIVEQGTANSGQYIKFDNGIMICTKSVSISNQAVVSAYFAGTYGTYCTMGNMPATFKELWNIQGTAQLSNTTDWMVGNIYNASVSSMGQVRICRPNASGNISGKVNVFAIGTWK